MIILDEWGVCPAPIKQGAQLLFRIISDSYERRSLIITTISEFSRWGGVLTDEPDGGPRLFDRLAHHGHLVGI